MLPVIITTWKDIKMHKKADLFLRVHCDLVIYCDILMCIFVKKPSKWIIRHQVKAKERILNCFLQSIINHKSECE